MSTPDKNYVIVSGNPNGELFLDDGRIGVRQQLRQAGDFTVIKLELGDILPPDASYADVLKISGAEYVEIRVGHLMGGKEDCIDINHSHHVKLWVDWAESRGTYVNTTKGGSTDIEIHIASLTCHGTETDIDLGNWSDQSKDKTRGVIIDIKSVVSVRVRVLHADKPTILNPEQRYEIYAPWWRSLFYPVYGLLKKLHLA